MANRVVLVASTADMIAAAQRLVDHSVGIRIVGTTTDTFEGQQLVREFSPDLVLIHANPGSGSSVEFVSQLKLSHPSMRVVGCGTLLNAEEFLRQCGVDDYVHLPPRAEAFIKALGGKWAPDGAAG